MIRLLLVDDKEVVRRGWRMRLGLESDMQVVAEAANGAAALRLVRAAAPDVVLLDVRLSAGENGLDWILPLRQCNPHARVIVITVYDSDPNVERALAEGADALVSKERPFDDLLLAIRRAMRGEARL